MVSRIILPALLAMAIELAMIRMGNGIAGISNADLSVCA